MKTFERTHPWIKFELDLRRADPRLWMMLGEASSKCEHMAGVPLRPATARDLLQLYLAKGVAATTAIEGNTLTEEEVRKHLDGDLKLSPSKEYLAQEIDNIVKACNQITEDLKQGREVLTPERLGEFNWQVLMGLKLEEGVVPGDLRTYSVGVGRYHGAPAEDCPYLLDRLCEWLSGRDFNPPRGMETVYAVLKAVTAHLYLAWIHPFGDGNGRTARLVEYLILMTAGVPQPACHLLSNHYNQTRNEYYRNLDYASGSGGDILPFLTYAIQGFVEGLREQLERIRNQQWDVTWRNYVYESFRERESTKVGRRQRRLVLDLGGQESPVPVHGIPLLTPKLAQEYPQKAYRTLLRDIKTLEEMGLIERTKESIRARREVILAFLPWRKG